MILHPNSWKGQGTSGAMELEDKTSGMMGLEVFADQFSKASPWAGKGEGGARFGAQLFKKILNKLIFYVFIPADASVLWWAELSTHMHLLNTIHCILPHPQLRYQNSWISFQLDHHTLSGALLCIQWEISAIAFTWKRIIRHLGMQLARAINLHAPATNSAAMYYWQG